MSEIECAACRKMQEDWGYHYAHYGLFKCEKCGETFCFHHVVPVVEVEPKIAITWICEACFDGKEVK